MGDRGSAAQRINVPALNPPRFPKEAVERGLHMKGVHGGFHLGELRGAGTFRQGGALHGADEQVFGRVT